MTMPRLGLLTCLGVSALSATAFRLSSETDDVFAEGTGRSGDLNAWGLSKKDVYWLDEKLGKEGTNAKHADAKHAKDRKKSERTALNKNDTRLLDDIDIDGEKKEAKGEGKAKQEVVAKHSEAEARGHEEARAQEQARAKEETRISEKEKAKEKGFQEDDDEGNGKGKGKYGSTKQLLDGFDFDIDEEGKGKGKSDGKSGKSGSPDAKIADLQKQVQMLMDRQGVHPSGKETNDTRSYFVPPPVNTQPSKQQTDTVTQESDTDVFHSPVVAEAVLPTPSRKKSADGGAEAAVAKTAIPQRLPDLNKPAKPLPPAKPDLNKPAKPLLPAKRATTAKTSSKDEGKTEAKAKTRKSETKVLKLPDDSPYWNRGISEDGIAGKYLKLPDDSPYWEGQSDPSIAEFAKDKAEADRIAKAEAKDTPSASKKKGKGDTLLPMAVPRVPHPKFTDPPTPLPTPLPTPKPDVASLISSLTPAPTPVLPNVPAQEVKSEAHIMLTN